MLPAPLVLENLFPSELLVEESYRVARRGSRYLISIVLRQRSKGLQLGLTLDLTSVMMTSRAPSVKASYLEEPIRVVKKVRLDQDSVQ